MADNEYAGSALYATWVHSGGTVTLNTDFRTWTENKSLETIDATAGADANRRYIQSFKVIGVDCSILAQRTDGTAAYTPISLGTQGTLIWGPAGTVATYIKKTLPAFISQSNMAIPYADVVSIDLSFTANGTYSEANW